MNKNSFILLILAFFLVEVILNASAYAGILIYTFFAGLVLLSVEEEGLSHGGKLLIMLLIIPMAKICSLFVEGFLWKAVAFYSVLFFLALFYVLKFEITLEFPKKDSVWILGLSTIIGLLAGYLGNLYFGFEKQAAL